MGSASHHGPNSCHYLLEEARSVSEQYSYLVEADSTLHIDLRLALFKLLESLTTFQSQGGSFIEFQEVFCSLTGGLSECLGNLKYRSQNYACITASKGVEAGYSHSQNNSWAEYIRRQLLDATQVVGILNEAFNVSRFSFGAGSKEPLQSSQSDNQQYRRFASVSLRLKGALNSFLYGTLQQSSNGRWRSLDANQFSSGNLINYGIGQAIDQRLASAASASVDAEFASGNLIMWKIKRSLYWFSKNLDDLRCWKNHHLFRNHRLRPSDQGWASLASIFLDALKPAWLLCSMIHAYEQLPLELRCFLYCFEKKIIGHLNSYYETVFTSPNYELIKDLGDFNFGIELLATHLPMQLSSGSYSELQYAQTTSHPSNVYQFELEATGVPAFGSNQATPASSQVVNKPSDLNYRSVFPLDSDPISLVGMVDGLHVSEIEKVSPSAYGGNVPPNPNEVELLNVELAEIPNDWKGFEYNLSSRDLNNPNPSYISSRVRVFKIVSNFENYLRLYTYRENLETQSRLTVVNIPSAELVPEYAFAKNTFAEYAVADYGVDESKLYLRDSGMCSTLVYKFDCGDRFKNHYALELFGFQGALMGANFDGDYCASRLVLRRSGSPGSMEEISPRLQVWTDYPTQSTSSGASIVTAQSGMSSISERERKFSALTNSFSHNVNASRIYIFSHNKIYVIIISDRIKLERPHHGPFHRSGKLPKPTIRLVPNKHAGISAIRIRTLKGPGQRLPGIPLDASGLGFSDQDRLEMFDSYHSLEVEFNYEDDCQKFVSGFKDCMAGYQDQCAPVEEFRKLQRDKRYEVSSTVTFEKRKGRRGTN